MRGQFIITKVNHYDMGENRGLSVRVVGDKQTTNNSFGLDISEATVSDYSELRNLTQYKNDLPAKFDCDFALATVKAGNGKEKTGVVLSNLTFVNSVEFADKKVPVTAK
ncbi:hypothetical protein [Bacillus sp. B1-b2]|uniref:hypothetical protein n=1 Tax=Bacillus sp. B1-b2 TaxID=2653201 RepID=UPI0012625298|nr:hypothetical protein [Bacillus sp. B1-b2]KAB7663023.1 hypothetical protein F9279_24320 [Bacillus sp. B1-b2]